MTDSKSRCVVEISTDTRPIVFLTIDRLSTDCRLTIDRLSTDSRPLCRPTVDRVSTDCRPTVDRLATEYRPTVDRLSTDCRPLYRPLCRPLYRPMSRSTLPTVNKIRSNLKRTWKILKELNNRRVAKSPYPASFTKNGMEISNFTDIANNFCDYFTNKGPNLVSKIP